MFSCNPPSVINESLLSSLQAPCTFQSNAEHSEVLSLFLASLLLQHLYAHLPRLS